MKIAVIGRTEILYNTACILREAGHEITCILTAKEAPEYSITAADYKVLADQWRIPFAQGSRIVEHLDFLKASASEIAVSINYTGIVPQDVIDIFPLGILNAHGGDLPRYRGNACQAWAILNGEEKIGLCIHRMIGDELDSGDILARDYLQIDLNTKVGEVLAWIGRETPALFVDVLEKLQADSTYILERQSKDPKQALRCHPREPKDCRIDWGAAAVDVLRLINASNKPYAGAFCQFEGEKIIIWDANLSEDEVNFLAIPGQVTRLFSNGSIEVACGKGKIILTRIQKEDITCNPNDVIKSRRSRLT
jgi:methionyl-tRNA formyltransferase